MCPIPVDVRVVVQRSSLFWVFISSLYLSCRWASAAQRLDWLIGLVKVRRFTLLTDERPEDYRRDISTSGEGMENSNQVAMHFYDTNDRRRAAEIVNKFAGFIGRAKLTIPWKGFSLSLHESPWCHDAETSTSGSLSGDARKATTCDALRSRDPNQRCVRCTSDRILSAINHFASSVPLDIGINSCAAWRDWGEAFASILIYAATHGWKLIVCRVRCISYKSMQFLTDSCLFLRFRLYIYYDLRERNN